jgi:hypothetical protein
VNIGGHVFEEVIMLKSFDRIWTLAIMCLKR